MILTDSPKTRCQANKIISAGGVIAFRTDTFYGLGADPFNPAAVERIKQLKGREENKPILVVISDRPQVERFINSATKAFDFLAEEFWPGPLTLIGMARSELPVELTAGTQTLGVRLPDDDNVRALVRACGGALTATSANPAGCVPATNASQVEAYFGDAINLIVDEGEAETQQASTVVDASTDDPILIREGLIAWTEVQRGLHRKPIDYR